MQELGVGVIAKSGSMIRELCMHELGVSVLMNRGSRIRELRMHELGARASKSGPLANTPSKTSIDDCGYDVCLAKRSVEQQGTYENYARAS